MTPRHADRADPGPTSPVHLDRRHRLGAAGFGLVLAGFGVLGLVQRLQWFSTQGQSIAGLSSNGLLSLISLVVGGLLVAAGVRGGRMASTALVVFGVAFMLSGIVNVLVLTTPYNLLAFRMSNVIFSLVSGALLLIMGGWGRFTGRLPPDNPYRRERHPDEDRAGAGLQEQPVDGQGGGPGDVAPTVHRDATDIADMRDLAEAERAVARGGATRAQAEGVAAARRTRGAEDRLSGWRRRKGRHGTSAPPARDAGHSTDGVAP